MFDGLLFSHASGVAAAGQSVETWLMNQRMGGELRPVSTECGQVPVHLLEQGTEPLTAQGAIL